MKKLLSFALAMVLMLSLSVTVFAAGGTGSITINGIVDGVDYEIYKLLHLESYNKVSGAYAYTVDPAWTAFFATAEAQTYITVDSDGYVTWVAGDDDATIAAFAQMALAYAKDNAIAPVQVKSDMAITGNVGVFSNLELGWYLVDSTAGALCGLTTTDPDASIIAKNQIPTIDKQVQEDLTGMWGDVNTADIGQIVNFMTIIHVAAGAENYVLHDAMSEGLTFEQDLANGRGVTEIKLVNSLGVETILVLGADYIVKTTGLCANCDFEVVFTDTLMAKLQPNDRLLVYYNAMLNRYALVGGENTNESKLET
ncbi:MAG: isopeptide-forming domain-containing fimbrial protein, partial [Clostridia bacterium]|nr:isopeptide-forming domain-containing fimbrial protein [Clostridia bacterium]